MIKKIYEKEEKGIIYRKYQSDEYVIIVRDRRTNNDQSITKLHVEVNICGADNIIYPEIKFSKARKCFVAYPANGIFIDDVTYEPFMDGMKVAHAFTTEANQVLVQRILDNSIQDETYSYFFYSHMDEAMTAEMKQNIMNIIMDHDYEQFMEIKEYFERGTTLTYFPMYISKLNQNTSEYESIELTKETFSLITYTEYECG